MDKGRIKAVLFILLFLLVLAIAVYLLLDIEKEKREVIHLPSDSPAVTQAPAPPAPTETPAAAAIPAATPAPTPVPTLDPYIDTPSTPVPTLQPLPTPTPTPPPTPTPIPEGEVLAEGVFRSETGVGLNLRAVWTASVMDEKHVKVTVEIWLDSYSLHITQAYNCVNVSVGESFVSANAPTVDLEDNSLHETLLATTEHVLNLADGESRSFPVQVQYQFGGVYQQLELPVLECGGPIEIER